MFKNMKLILKIFIVLSTLKHKREYITKSICGEN